MELVGKIYSQHCGDDLLVIEKTMKQQYGDKGRYYYHCKFIKYPYELDATKPEIEKGTILNPQIEQIEFVQKEWPQKCGDNIKILGKTNIKRGNLYLWRVQFIKYPCELLVTKNQVLRGTLENPEIKKRDFDSKIWHQNCGDDLKIIKKVDNFYECEFLKYPYRIIDKKSNIILGKVNNPQIEIEEFIKKEWPQNCGDILTDIKKTDIYKGIYRLYEGTFKNYSYTGFFTKQDIKAGNVLNPKMPWLSRGGLINYIQNKYKENKPTLKELSEALGISYSHLSNKIYEYDLYEYIKKEAFSEPENELGEFIEQYIPIERNKVFSYKLFKNLKEQDLDVYIPSKKIGFEFNGSYWHSELFKDSQYHQQRNLNLREINIQLFHIWEYEWDNNRELCKSFIKSKLGIFKEKIGASKCKIKELDYKIYAAFCNENHLQGECGAKIKLGLFYKDELVQIMSFGVPRFTDKYEWEIIRECSKREYCIMGGKQKLWSYFLKHYGPNSVISYCDYSKFTGESYLKLGFRKISLNKPGFMWFDTFNKKVYKRTPWKHQEMKNKYLKIYDCGQLVFIWENK